MKKTTIKAIEINDQAHPELYAIIQELKDRGEDIPKLIRGLLLREFLSGHLMLQKASPEDVLNAIASQRRTIAITSMELDSLERRCSAVIGLPVEDGALQPKVKIQDTW